jgi:hypothetical protein
MRQVLINVIRSKGVLALLIISVIVLLFLLLRKPNNNGASSDSKIQKINDKEAALLVKNEYLNKEIESQSRTEDSLKKVIEIKDVKIFGYEKELSKFKTLKNEKHTVINNYTPDQIDSAMSREGFHTYGVKTLR